MVLVLSMLNGHLPEIHTANLEVNFYDPRSWEYKSARVSYSVSNYGWKCAPPAKIYAVVDTSSSTHKTLEIDCATLGYQFLDKHGTIQSASSGMNETVVEAWWRDAGILDLPSVKRERGIFAQCILDIGRSPFAKTSINGQWEGSVTHSSITSEFPNWYYPVPVAISAMIWLLGLKWILHNRISAPNS